MTAAAASLAPATAGKTAFSPDATPRAAWWQQRVPSQPNHRGQPAKRLGGDESAGDFVVTWESGSDDTNYDVYARWYAKTAAVNYAFRH